MKMFVSKYALSEGIKEVEGDLSTIAVYPVYYMLKVGTDCHHTREEAVAAAEAMRVQKISSLRKQIAELEKLNFGEE